MWNQDSIAPHASPFSPKISVASSEISCGSTLTAVPLQCERESDVSNVSASASCLDCDALLFVPVTDSPRSSDQRRTTDNSAPVTLRTSTTTTASDGGIQPSTCFQACDLPSGLSTRRFDPSRLVSGPCLSPLSDNEVLRQPSVTPRTLLHVATSLSTEQLPSSADLRTVMWASAGRHQTTGSPPPMPSTVVPVPIATRGGSVGSSGNRESSSSHVGCDSSWGHDSRGPMNSKRLSGGGLSCGNWVEMNGKGEVRNLDAVKVNDNIGNSNNNDNNSSLGGSEHLGGGIILNVGGGNNNLRPPHPVSCGGGPPVNNFVVASSQRTADSSTVTSKGECDGSLSSVCPCCSQTLSGSSLGGGRPTAEVASSSSQTEKSGKGTTGRLMGGYVPRNPYNLPKSMRLWLDLTELRFLILWVYFAYFMVVVCLTVPYARQTVWLNATVAGLLVGIGLNANAYRAIVYKGSPDYGMVVRFFLIPFGVSALSGLTNSLRDQFILVFPKDPVELSIAICTPAVVVTCLLLSRCCLLPRFGIPLTIRNILCNGKIFA